MNILCVRDVGKIAALQDGPTEGATREAWRSAALTALEDVVVKCKANSNFKAAIGAEGAINGIIAIVRFAAVRLFDIYIII